MNWFWVAILLGGYYTGGGAGHPSVSFDIDAKIGVTGETYGVPTAVGGGFEHAAVQIKPDGVQQFVDLFYIYAFVESGGENVKVMATGGYANWRQWICTGTSCEADPGPGQRFSYTNGLGGSLGVSYVNGALRSEVRYRKYFFDAPTDDDLTFSVGFVIQ